jgi:ketosteroid isomerase-like protein
MEELLARDDMRQLAERYALAVDGKDVDTLAGLFVEDVDNGRHGQGRAGVRRFYDERLRLFHCSMHLVGNHVIDFDSDDRASGIVYCRAQHHAAESDHWFDIALAYFDAYERHGDRWYFRRRRVRTWYRQEQPTGRVLAEPGASGPTRGSRLPDAFPTFDAFWARPPAGPA